MLKLEYYYFMKKFLFIIFLALNFCLMSNNFFVQAESLSFEVCTDYAVIVLEPNSENYIKLKELNYGDEVSLISKEKISDEKTNSNLTFYKVLIDNENIGYILTNVVCEKDSFSVKFSPNAKLCEDSEVFIKNENNFDNMKIENEIVKLEQNSNIKILEKFDKNSTYTQISFEFNNEILTGYVLTKNILVSGFNYWFLIIIFVLIIIFSTIIPIIIKNYKKKKSSQIISTSPHKTSK